MRWPGADWGGRSPIQTGRRRPKPATARRSKLNPRYRDVLDQPRQYAADRKIPTRRSRSPAGPWRSIPNRRSPITIWAISCAISTGSMRRRSAMRKPSNTTRSSMLPGSISARCSITSARRPESAEALRRVIAVDPSRGEPYFQLAVTLKLKMDDPAVAAMRRLYDDPKTPDAERMFLAFGAGPGVR